MLLITVIITTLTFVELKVLGFLQSEVDLKILGYYSRLPFIAYALKLSNKDLLVPAEADNL
jgi:NADH:ubiquinone oxidoreductase subunit H